MGFDAKKSDLSSAVRALYSDPKGAASQAVDKIAAARVWLLKEKPFFGVLARALHVEPTLDTTAFRLTADDRLRVNPLVVLELKFPSLCARVAHVTLHAALGALVRRGAREPRRWNVAHDLAIDPLLRAARLHVGASLPALDLPNGASADEYYALLEEGIRPDDAWCDVSDPPATDDAPPAGTFTRQDDGEGDEDPGEQGEGEGEGANEGQDDRDDDDDDDENERDAGASGDATTAEARGRELQWKMRLAGALEEEIASGNKSFGEIPLWIEELVQATIEPPPDWTAVLARSVESLTREHRTFLRPSRRQSALAGEDGAWPDVVSMPGRRVVPAGKLVAVVDTSCSIDAKVLARFLGAIASVATTEGFDEVRLMQADAEVTKDELVFAAELLFRKVAMTGRGGTDFSPALELLADDSKRDAERYTVVYFTDLDGRFPPAEAVAWLDVLWVVPGKVPRAPPFGRVVEMR